LTLLIKLREEVEVVVFRLASAAFTLRDDSLVQRPPRKQRSSPQSRQRRHRSRHCRLHRVVAQDERVLR
jgi:hypothetical protein